MRADKDFVIQKFHYFNKQIFGNTLPMLPIRIGHAKTSLGGLICNKKRTLLGKTQNYNFRMVISSYRDLPENELEDVIIHEMIHYYIAYKQIKDSSAHGKIFQRMMNEINKRYGRHIAISKRHTAIEQTNNASTIGKPRYVCISQLSDGRIGVTVAAKTRIFMLWKQIPMCFKIESCAWYFTSAPYFSRFPSSIKPKIYIGDRDEIIKSLKGAILLKNDEKRITKA